MNLSIRKTALLTASATVSFLALAAASFDPSEQPFGYIAPVVISDNDVASQPVAFAPRFEFGTYAGDLVAAPILDSGDIDLDSPLWRAADQLDAQDWDDERFIVTMDLEGSVVPFRKDDISKEQKDYLKKDEKKRIEFLRGERKEEGKKFRTRASVLGDIIHSNPVYVGPPKATYNADNYAAFADYHANRAARVYVGANDGMLHAFDAETGAETFAYIPSMLIPKLKGLAEPSYVHDYFVDGPLTAGDAYFDGAWSTLLIGTLGAGGRGLFALDVTSAAQITDEGNGPDGAGSRVLWEATPSSPGLSNLGFTYARASIVKLNNDRWAVAVGNGYLSNSGVASLLLLDPRNGSVIRELVTTDSNDNGLSTPTLVDVDRDGKVDYAYAGDLNGNLWRFDLTAPSSASWDVSFGGDPLLVTAGSNGARQPITTAVDVSRHPAGGYFVYAATGRLLATEDGDDHTEQAVYGVWDNDWDPADLPLLPMQLLPQAMIENVHSSGRRVRTATDKQPDWAFDRGWRLSLEAVGGLTGERVIQDLSLSNGRVNVSSMNPTTTNGENWSLQINALTGGAPVSVVFDLDADQSFSAGDNVDGDGNSKIEDVGVDRVMGLYLGTGLVSSATDARFDDYRDASIVNVLAGTNPIHGGDPGGDPAPGDPEPGDDDYGLAGGHMDLDVASQTYPIGGGKTDKHDHEWDNDYGVVVDFFLIDEQGGFRAIDTISDLPGSDSYAPFIINVVNAGLSPAGVLEINGDDFPVIEWQAKVRRFLANSMRPGEFMPVFMLEPPSASQAAKGIYQLTSFKMKFSTDAIIVGGLHPSVTGCVKSNHESPNGEYRNGALTTQLLDASGLSYANGAADPSSLSYDYFGRKYGTSTFAIHDTLNYAMPPAGKTHGPDDGLFWESTLFWHWSGGCYNIQRIEQYERKFEELVGYPDTRTIDGEPTGNYVDPYDTTEPPDDTDPGSDTTGEPDVSEPEHTEHSTQTDLLSSGGGSGRLYWREWLPDGV